MTEIQGLRNISVSDFNVPDEKAFRMKMMIDDSISKVQGSSIGRYLRVL